MDTTRGRLARVIVVGIVAIAAVGLRDGTQAYQDQADRPWLNECYWQDPNGADVGPIITYIPPDTPASGGYQCLGRCSKGSRAIGCKATSPFPEGGGVMSQECSCNFGLLYEVPN